MGVSFKFYKFTKIVLFVGIYNSQYCSYSVSPLDEEDDQDCDLSDLDIGDDDLRDNGADGVSCK